jgi:hypothetical protein
MGLLVAAFGGEQLFAVDCFVLAPALAHCHSISLWIFIFFQKKLEQKQKAKCYCCPHYYYEYIIIEVTMIPTNNNFFSFPFQLNRIPHIKAPKEGGQMMVLGALKHDQKYQSTAAPQPAQYMP